MRHLARALLRFAFVLLAASGAAACSGDTFAGAFDADGGGEAGSRDVMDGPRTRGPADDAAASDATTIWVDPRPRPAARSDAFASIQRAIDEAARRRVPRVAVCAGVYREALALAGGVAVEGGFACDRASPHPVTRVVAPTSPAVVARDLADVPSGRARLARVEIVAPDGRIPSASSLALLAVRAPGLTLADVRLVAGRGADGADGAPALALRDATTKDGSGATPGTNACVGAIGREGGAGGDGGAGGSWRVVGGALVVDPSAPRTDGGAQPATSETALGGTLSTPPRAGRDGRAGSPGASAVSFGALGEAGFVTGDGAAGGDGAPGQGGGGGAGVPPLVGEELRSAGAWTPGIDGGGGGAGGCPGLAGGAGRGGGASVALLTFASELTLEGDVALVTGDGGRGGRGTTGSAPTAGGRGATAPERRGRAGAGGGAGGPAGFSGHGAGGPSIAWARRGSSPAAAAGAAGARLVSIVGAAGAGRPAEGPIPRSADGVAAASYAF